MNVLAAISKWLHIVEIFFLLWDLGFISFRLWLNEHFFLPHGISIIIATVIGNTMAQQCVATRKIKISFNFYNSSLQCDLSISVARNIKEKNTASQEIGKILCTQK